MKLLQISGFISLIIILMVKLNFYLLFNRDKKLGALILKYSNSNHKKAEIDHIIRKVNRINKRIDFVIDFLPLRKTCLIRSLVKKEYHNLNNIVIDLFIGVKREDEKIIAHAWVGPLPVPGNNNFKVLYKI